MNFAHVRHGSVVRWFIKLPPVFGGVKGFPELPPERRAEHGVLPVVDLTPTINRLTHRYAKRMPAVAVYADRVEIVRPTELLGGDPGTALEQLRADAIAAVDAKAEAVRQRYITRGDGQATTYIYKALQADAFKAGGYQGTPPGFIQAEMNATGKTAQEACDYIIETRDYWLGKAVEIEDLRRSWDETIKAAVDESAILSARASAFAALDVL